MSDNLWIVNYLASRYYDLCVGFALNVSSTHSCVGVDDVTCQDNNETRNRQIVCSNRQRLASNMTSQSRCQRRVARFYIDDILRKNTEHTVLRDEHTLVRDEDTVLRDEHTVVHASAATIDKYLFNLDEKKFRNNPKLDLHELAVRSVRSVRSSQTTLSHVGENYAYRLHNGIDCQSMIHRQPEIVCPRWKSNHKTRGTNDVARVEHPSRVSTLCSKNEDSNVLSTNLNSNDVTISSEHINTNKTDVKLPTWVYCTRYSDRPSAGPRCRRKVKDGPRPRRKRTSFTEYQLSVLHDAYRDSPYLNDDTRQQLANKLTIDVSKIKVWFQNKRANEKKMQCVKNTLALRLMADGLYDHSTRSTLQ